MQHFLYCERRWGLLEINDDWSENHHVAKGMIIHDRVHSGKHKFSNSLKKVVSNISVYNDDLGIYGKIDCLEFNKSENGAFIPELSGNYQVTIIEYKPTFKKKGGIVFADKMQLFMQKLCVDYIWKTNAKSCMYYSNIKKRVEVCFKEDFDSLLETIENTIKSIKYYRQKSILPQKKKGQKCGGCSMKDLCFAYSSPINTKSQIFDSLELENEKTT